MNLNSFTTKIWKLYVKYFNVIEILLYIALCLMVSHMKIINNRTIWSILCLWVVTIYFLWYIYPKPKNKYIYGIPLFLYAIGYYILHWNSIFNITKTIWNGIFG